MFGVPCIFLARGYLLGAALGMDELPCVGMAAIGLLWASRPPVLVNRALTRRQAPEFVILKHLA